MQTQALFQAIEQEAQKRFAFVKTGPATDIISFTRDDLSVDYPLYVSGVVADYDVSSTQTAQDLLKRIPITEHSCGIYLTGVRIAEEYIPRLGKTKCFIHLACFIVDEWCVDCEIDCGSVSDGSLAMVSKC